MTRSKNGVGQGGNADQVVPAVHGNLTGDDDGALVVAILDDFEEIARLVGIERLRAPIVENEQLYAGERAQEPGVAGGAVDDGEIGEETGNADVEDGDVLPTSLVPESAGEPTLAQAAGAGDQQIAMFGDPVAGGELKEQRPVEPARILIVDVLDAGAVAQFGGAGAGLELLLPAQGRFMFQQQSEPFGVIEAARLGFVFEVLEPLGEAIEGRARSIGRAWDGRAWEASLSGSSRGRADWRGRRAWRGGASLPTATLGVAGEQRGDALAVEDAQFDGAGRNGFEARDIQAAIGAQNPKAGTEALFGMGPAGEHG